MSSKSYIIKKLNIITHEGLKTACNSLKINQHNETVENWYLSKYYFKNKRLKKWAITESYQKKFVANSFLLTNKLSIKNSFHNDVVSLYIQKQYIRGFLY